MFNAKIDRIVHKSFVQDIMKLCSVTEDKAEEWAVKLEQQMNGMWNKPFIDDGYTVKRKFCGIIKRAHIIPETKPESNE